MRLPLTPPARAGGCEELPAAPAAGSQVASSAATPPAAGDEAIEMPRDTEANNDQLGAKQDCV